MQKQDVVVGTLSPAKLAGCEKAVIALKRPQHFQIAGCEVPSKVSALPVGEAVCLRGARHRALGCRSLNPKAELFVGIESGLRSMPGKTLAMTTYAYVLHRSGFYSFASSSSHPIAAAYGTPQALPQFTQGNESIRALTNGAYTLADKVFEATICALATLYQKIDAETRG